MPKLYGSLTERFLSKFIQGAPDECWNWSACLDKHGYGHMGGGKVNYPAHRFSYSHFIGPIPAGMCVCHTCDNRACVNPAHLFLGTSQDNTADRTRKGRSAKGERSPKAKLTPDQAREILARSKAGEGRASLGREFGITETAVRFIATGKNWKHLEEHNG